MSEATKTIRLDGLKGYGIRPDGGAVYFVAVVDGADVEFAVYPQHAELLGQALQTAAVKAYELAAPTQPLGAPLNKEVLEMQSAAVQVSGDGEFLLLTLQTTPHPTKSIKVPWSALASLQKEVRIARDRMEKIQAANRPHTRN